jgi:hypothetical protein
MMANDGSDSEDDVEVIMVPRLSMPKLEVVAGGKERIAGMGKGAVAESMGKAAGNVEGGVVRSTAAADIGLGTAAAAPDAPATSAAPPPEPKRKTRRSGLRARRRVDNGLARDDDAVESELGGDNPGTPTPRGTTSLASPSAAASFHHVRKPGSETSSLSSGYSYDDSDTSDSDADEVDAMSDLDSLASGQTPPTASASVRGSVAGNGGQAQRSSAGSVISAEDAQSSIDE